MSSEKEPLLKKEERVVEKANGTSQFVGFRHTLIVPMVILFYLPAEIMVYIVNEWIHDKVTTQQFPNVSLYKTSSPCEEKNQSHEASTEYQHAERVISEWLLYNRLAEYMPLLIVNMILPSYSDTYGRKFVIITAMLGLLAKDVLISVTIYFDLHIYVVTGAYGIEGLTGAGGAIDSMAFAFIADITTSNKNRVLGIVAIEAVFLLASLCPGFIAGYMVESGLQYPYSAIICAGTMSTALIFAILLPETLPPEKRVSHKSVLHTMKRTFDFYMSSDFKGQRTFYILLVLAYAVSCVAVNNRGTMETLYFLDQPFCWNPISFGHFTLARQAFKAVFGTLTLRPLQKCLSNEAILIITASSTLASFIIEGLATTLIVVYVAAGVGSVSFLNTPLIRGIMSSMTTADRQGSMFASLSVISSLSSLLSYLSMNLVYNATISIMNGFVFLVMAAFCAIQVFLLVGYYCNRPNSIKSDVESVNNDQGKLNE